MRLNDKNAYAMFRFFTKSINESYNALRVPRANAVNPQFNDIVHSNVVDSSGDMKIESLLGMNLRCDTHSALEENIVLHVKW